MEGNSLPGEKDGLLEAPPHYDSLPSISIDIAPSPSIRRQHAPRQTRHSNPNVNKSKKAKKKRAAARRREALGLQNEPELLQDNSQFDEESGLRILLSKSRTARFFKSIGPAASNGSPGRSWREMRRLVRESPQWDEDKKEFKESNHRLIHGFIVGLAIFLARNFITNYVAIPLTCITVVWEAFFLLHENRRMVIAVDICSLFTLVPFILCASV